MKSKEEVITPQLATEYLENAIDNRPISETHVDVLAREMREGRWRLTHQGIAFNHEGKLVDGQHRLWAIIKSGVSVLMVTTHGLSGESLDTVDCGRKRSFTDYEVLSGNKITGAYESTLRGMFLVGDATKVIPTSRLRELWAIHHHAVTYTMKLFNGGAANGFQRGVNIAPVRAVVCRATYTSNLNRLEQFVHILKTGLMSDANDEAAIKLRNSLITPATLGHRTAFEPTYRKTERALQSFLAHEPLKKIYEATEELFPLPKEHSNGK